MKRRRTTKTRAFTLVELTSAIVIMGVLMTAMTSVILLATKALPNRSTPASLAATGANALQQIATDLAVATSIPKFGPSRVTLTVADRGHGAAGAEMLQYSWTGVAGAPLTYLYNDTNTTLVNNVYGFTSVLTQSTQSPTTPPRVLLVVNDATALTTEDQARIDLLNGWNMTVQTISASVTAPTLATAALANDVVYVALGCYSNGRFVNIASLTRGVVTEERDTHPLLLTNTSSSNANVLDISIVDNSHDITSGLPLGLLIVDSQLGSLLADTGTVAAGAEVLARSPIVGLPMLVALDKGATTTSGTAAAGRRVTLPWGKKSWLFGSLTGAGKQLLRQSLVWAAGRQVITDVTLELQVGPYAESRVRTSARLLNRPRADGD